MIKTGNYTIIPMGITCAVIEHNEDGTVSIIGDSKTRPLEDTFNGMRKTLLTLADSEMKVLEQTEKSFRKFTVTKEFLSPMEIEIAEAMWKGYEPEKFRKECEDFHSRYTQSALDMTDLMLEHNIVIKATDENGNEEPIKAVNMDTLKDIFDGLGKTE